MTVRGPLAPLLLAALLLAGVTGSAAAASPSAELPLIERHVMCVTCKIPLNVAQSVQADRERVYIRSLLAHGSTPAQVEHALVGQYGPTVLALPSDSGFDLAAYLVPILVLIALLALLAALLPRWRARARARAVAIGGEGSIDSPSSLTPAQRARLDADLTRFER
ncbi:MAG TPA: cytochrome c-type biogenesis protein CcmH [Solirubrobacteraceae bacterium]|nr:cytochrome c-type biogenesis protein CcmH [Solirubrobacteraceae bacterium]